jgi:hypothetical protein
VQKIGKMLENVGKWHNHASLGAIHAHYKGDFRLTVIRSAAGAS